jgi:hypothetical protein
MRQPIDNLERHDMTFEQAEGAELLPTQLNLREISKELRARLWEVIYYDITNQVDHHKRLFGSWYDVLHDFYVKRKFMMVDEISARWDWNLSQLKRIISSGDYIAVFGFLQFVIRHENCPYEFADKIEKELQEARAAYRLIDGRTIMPIVSETDQSTIEQALADLSETEFKGARAHLVNAGAELTAGEYSASIRESIHAVEAVARMLSTSGSLSDALAKLEKHSAIHGGLKSGFNAIYGYTSDEKGIRHSLLNEPQSRVDEADALFMIGACSAFISYLLQKARNSGIIAN